MEQILIPRLRAKLLTENPSLISDLERKLKCEIEVHNENEVVVNGEAYDEYNARNVIQAFGRGFELNDAYKLLNESYFFKTIDIKQLFKSKDQVRRIKGRVIGEDGRTKEYIQSVSGATVAVYGDTISIIGTIEEMKIAESAIDVLLDGGTHKKAYRVMESIKRRMTEARA